MSLGFLVIAGSYVSYQNLRKIKKDKKEWIEEWRSINTIMNPEFKRSLNHSWRVA